MSTDPSRTGTLVSFAGTLLPDGHLKPVESVMDAVAAILVSIITHALAGTDHVPDPGHSTIEKCSVAACFMAACSVPLLSWLREEGHELDAQAPMHLAGSRVFASFGEHDRKTIMDSGITLLREMVHLAKENRRMEEWLTSVHDVTERYVLTEGRSDCVELIAPLYLVLLMATRQMKP